MSDMRAIPVRYIRHKAERMDTVIPQVPVEERIKPVRRTFGGRTGYAIPLTFEAAQIIGLNDPDRYRDLSRERDGVKFCWYFGEQQAVQDLVNELYDRATEGSGGFDESPRNKAIMRRALKRAARQGFYPNV